MTDPEAVKAATDSADWTQVVLNGGPPCFHVDDYGRFCFRAERWAGHGFIHDYVSLSAFVAVLASRVRELEAAEVERQGRVCETCFFSTDYKSIQFCTRSSTGATHHIQGRWRRTALMGHTCGAWAPRTEAKS